MIFKALLFGSSYLLVPLVCLMSFVLQNIFSWVRKRISFENSGDDPKEVDYSFQFSSEGEFEQISSLVSLALSKRKTCQLIYSSTSVDHRLKDLKGQFPKLIRLSPLPVISLKAFDRIIFGKKIFMVRYDFYPHLIKEIVSKKINLIVLSARVSSFENTVVKKWYYLSSLKLASQIYCSNEKSFAFLKSKLPQSINIDEADFRILRIFDRLKIAEETLRGFPEIEKIFKKMSLLTNIKKLLFASFHLEDLFLIDQNVLDQVKNKKLFLVLIPHDLNWSKERLDFGSIVKVVTTQTRLKENLELGYIYLLNIKGILLESFSCFSHAYIGGGFGKGIHSLLEPYASNCVIGHGPKVEKSTEYEYVKKAGQGLFLCESGEELLGVLNKRVPESRTPLNEASLRDKLELILGENTYE